MFVDLKTAFIRINKKVVEPYEKEMNKRETVRELELKKQHSRI